MNKEILAAVSDMIFASKISGTATHSNCKVSFAKSIEQLTELALSLNPSLIILDLNNPRFDSLRAIKEIKSNINLSAIPIIGFLSHIQVELRQQAEEAGCDYVMPRSQFNNKLHEILSGEYFQK